MKCPNCGGQMGLEDAQCPYCGTPNTMAVQHQSDMARYQQEYQRTQESVIEKTSLLQRHGSWLIILSILLVALVIGVILQAKAWDIGYSIREQNVASNAAEDWQTMDAYLEAGDYGKFYGYYAANDINLDYDNPYQGLQMAAMSYADLLQYVCTLNDPSNFEFTPDYLGRTCGYIAEDLNRIYTIERQYSYALDRYLPEDKRVYLDDIRARTAVIAKAYFGLTDEDIEEIPNVSTQRLAVMVEEGLEGSGEETSSAASAKGWTGAIEEGLGEVSRASAEQLGDAAEGLDERSSAAAPQSGGAAEGLAERSSAAAPQSADAAEEGLSS